MTVTSQQVAETAVVLMDAGTHSLKLQFRAINGGTATLNAFLGGFIVLGASSTMEGLNEQQIIDTYRDAPALYGLHDGRDVIGHEADAENRLVYVVRRGEEITLEYATDVQPIMTIVPTPGHSVTVTARLDNPSLK